LTGEPPARRERADQRHFAGFVLLEANYAREWLSCRFLLLHSEQIGEVGGQRNEAKLLVGGPFVTSAAGFLVRRSAEHRGEPRAGRGPHGPALERQTYVITIRNRANPKLNVVIARGGKRWPRYGRAKFSSKLRDRGNLWKRERLAQSRSGLALQRLKFGIGGHEPARPVEPSKHGPWI
jgi:hypothetical protein